MSKLTIAIPTYNRTHCLKRNLSLLLGQVNDECEILILDNCSLKPVANELNEFVEDDKKDKVRIVRHKCNIGGNANILRCFELCETEWMWILSDAYPIEPTAVALALEHCRSGRDLVFVNFCHFDGVRKTSQKTTGLNEFVEKLDNFGNVLMISEGIYNVKRIIPYLAHGFHYGYTLAPHIVMVLLACADGASCFFSEKRLTGRKDEVGENNWSIALYSYIMAIADVRLPTDCRRVLVSKVADDILQYIVPMVKHSCILAVRNEDTKRYVNKWELMRLRAKQAGVPLLMRWRLFVYGLVVKFPHELRFFWRVVKREDIANLPVPTDGGF